MGNIKLINVKSKDIIMFINFYKKNYFIIFTLILINTLFSQNSSTIQFNTFPTNDDYWWLNNNNYGKQLSDTEIEYTFETRSNKTEYKVTISNSFQDNDYVIDENGNIVDQIFKGKKLSIGESFVKHNFSEQTFIRIGKYYRDFSKYLNDDLSSGSMLISRNAQPMPKIGLVHKYTFNDKLDFEVGISHGVFERNNFYSKKAPFLHEKFVYMNFKNNQNKFSVGFVHEAMWAGETENYGSFPSSLRDYFKIFVSADGEQVQGSPHANALGNHLGIWDFHYERNINTEKIKIYYQHIFEDTSSLRFANKFDGLWGIELENFIKNHSILLEYLNTSHAYDNPPYQADRYYWNHQYRTGWSYEGNIIGNPYVNANRSDDTNMTRLKDLTKLVHFGLNGQLSSIYYNIKASRRINSNDFIKYRIEVGKSVNNKLKVSLFVVNNSVNDGLGLSIFYSF